MAPTANAPDDPAPTASAPTAALPFVAGTTAFLFRAMVPCMARGRNYASVEIVEAAWPLVVDDVLDGTE